MAGLFTQSVKSGFTPKEQEPVPGGGGFTPPPSGPRRQFPKIPKPLLWAGIGILAIAGFAAFNTYVFRPMVEARADAAAEKLAARRVREAEAEKRVEAQKHQYDAPKPQRFTPLGAAAAVPKVAQAAPDEAAPKRFTPIAPVPAPAPAPVPAPTVTWGSGQLPPVIRPEDIKPANLLDGDARMDSDDDVMVAAWKRAVTHPGSPESWSNPLTGSHGKMEARGSGPCFNYEVAKQWREELEERHSTGRACPNPDGTWTMKPKGGKPKQ